MADLIPSAVKNQLERECKKMAQKIGKKIKPEDLGKKAEDTINKQVCKEVKSIDKRVVQAVVDELKKQLAKNKKNDSPVPSPDAAPVGSMKPPGSGVPSITIPITEFLVDKKLGTKAKFELKVWADPRDLQKDKGVMLNFSVVEF